MKYDEFTEGDWQRIRHDWADWWDGRLSRPLIVICTQDDRHPVRNIHNNLARFPIGTPPDTILDYYQPYLETTNYYGDAFPYWWLNAGPGIVAAFLGATPQFYDDGDGGTTWFDSRGCPSIQELHPAYDMHNSWWQHCLTLSRAAAARWGSQVVVGLSDLGGNLDILASLRGTQELLFDVVDAPQELERLTRLITGLWTQYYDALHAIIHHPQLGSTDWSGFWCPGKGYILQSDFSYMISCDMFERFVLPDLTNCCKQLEYPFYHLDGKGALRHLDHLLSIPGLRGVQWQPGDGQPLADEWISVLQRIRAAGKLCQVYVTRAGALKIARFLGGTGFQFHIVERDLTAQEADAFVALMKSGW